MNFIFSPPYPTRFLPNSWWPRNEWILDRSQTDLQRIPKYSSFNLEAASSNSPCFPFLWCPLVTSLFLGVKLICSFVAVKRACRSQSPCGGVGGIIPFEASQKAETWRGLWIHLVASTSLWLMGIFLILKDLRAQQFRITLDGSLYDGRVTKHVWQLRNIEMGVLRCPSTEYFSKSVRDRAEVQPH